MNHFPEKLQGSYKISSKEFEVNIRDLEILDKVISADDKPCDIPIQLKAHVYRILTSVLLLAKAQLIEIKKLLIKESLHQYKSKVEKLNFLNRQITFQKQTDGVPDFSKVIFLPGGMENIRTRMFQRGNTTTQLPTMT